ncbi:hypothetical protein [Tuwongella immobilis]|uniref:Nitrite reductase (NAD(P)H) large subunit, NirD n=1 Tax=Tuwongella immobilis TaxID=692036 RepID=A0A6C2YQ35_9BACT|nr:hypothetical protein [Tuwongella immobilis]VIP03289.1 Nitrite reductase (NAD(P)H) large subunit, NirD OS=Planctomyces maris DSM 8797 GN=PM8797T_09729 PE=4 SV=1 [Tuwongella immobilis]VTS03950.1 Nitrite reductase (NAD(P)H) large subunit, NirD OS=Planctomyces maris DSM 8797 GN=PM8797T_09729 PE=4 SV=1 [Tuwongella immobilis]
MAIRLFLVEFGKSGFLGRFGWEGPTVLQRDQTVVIESERGVELGVVRCELELPPQASGTVRPILRSATEADHALSQSLQHQASQLLAEFEQHVERAGLPVACLDSESLLDDQTVVLHLLPWADCDLSPSLESLCANGSRRILVEDHRRLPAERLTEPETKGCGKPGCGSASSGGCSSCGSSSGGGCSTGGCSRGSVAGSDELTEYFRSLRDQLDAQTETISASPPGRLPLN